jgi:hypothetical protein
MVINLAFPRKKITSKGRRMTINVELLPKTVKC